ncbi:UDP-Glycosyltransferase/glycogen phosphorylase [Neoconidiobolus thromboides FSU 785]|nr:UDP-Glycosyltransferase/glycogen phosphorylase [Neoconidiobolus thromboides FSU 785]
MLLILPLLLYLLSTLFNPIHSFKILLNSGMGGKSHIKSVLEIAFQLKLRGHRIYYVAPKENEAFISGYNFTYFQSGSVFNDKWNIPLAVERIGGFNQKVDKFRIITTLISEMLPAIYEDSFESFLQIVKELEPDVLLCDFFSPVCRDVGKMTNIPIINTFQHADMYGLQSKGVISNSFGVNKLYLSECSFFERLHDIIYLKIKENYYLLPLVNKMKELRVKFKAPKSNNPLGDWDKDLAIANTFFPYEPILPTLPNFHMIGPIFNKNYSLLSEELEMFLNQHEKVIYIAFGSNLNLGNIIMNKFLTLLIEGLNQNVYNSIIIGLGRTKLNFNFNLPNFNYTINQLINNQHPNIRILNWAPQQSILKHNNLKLFLSHCGLESTFEALNSNVPLLCHPFFADQPRSSQKVQYLNVGNSFDIHINSIEEVLGMMKQLLNDNNIKNNLLKINQIIKNRIGMEEYGANLIESHLNLIQLCNKNSNCYNNHLTQIQDNIWLDYYLDIILFLTLLITSILSLFLYLLYQLFLKFYRNNTSVKLLKKNQ